MRFNNPYLDTQTKIELLQKWILLHSYIYYVLNRNVVSDKVYDDNCRQLYDLMGQNTKAKKRSKWYRVFKGYHYSTGFDLISRLEEIMPGAIHEISALAYMVIELDEKFKIYAQELFERGDADA